MYTTKYGGKLPKVWSPLEAFATDTEPDGVPALTELVLVGPAVEFKSPPPKPPPPLGP